MEIEKGFGEQELLKKGDLIEEYPYLSIFSDKNGIKDILIRIKENIQVLEDSYYIIQNRHYRAIWKRFIVEIGVWLTDKDPSYLYDVFDIISCKFNFQLITIWFFEGFLLKSSMEIEDETVYKILDILKQISLDIAFNKNYIKRCDYLSLLIIISRFINKYSPIQWKEWIFNDISNFKNLSKINNYQSFIINISLYYLQNINSDRILINNFMDCITNLISPIIASDLNFFSKFTIDNIIKISFKENGEIPFFVTGIFKHIKRSVKCINALMTLEYVIKKTIDKFEWCNYFRDIFLVIIGPVSNSVSNMISNSNNITEDDNNDSKIIKISLNICFLLFLNKADKNILSELENVLLNINSNKNTVQVKISYLLITTTIIESLIKYRIRNNSFNYDISAEAQEYQLSLMDVKIPITSNNYTDHFKVLAIHLNSLTFVLMNKLNNHNFTTKYLSKIRSFINEQSINELNKLMIISSFIHAIHLIKIFKCTNEIDIDIIKEIIFSNITSNIFKSALNKTSQLKRLSISIIGQIISIKDFFNEVNIFKKLDIVMNIKNSSLLYPKLNTILDRSYRFSSNKNNNAEVNQLIFLLEIISNNNNRDIFEINYLNIDESKFNLYNYIEILKDPIQFQSLNYFISFLIQLGRVLSFISPNSDVNLAIVQYSNTDMELFRGILLIPNLKKPIEINNRSYSLLEIFKNDLFFKDPKVCQNMIISFAVLLSSLYSIKEKNREDLIFQSEVINDFKLPKFDLFKIWISLSSMKGILDGPSVIGYSCCILFLLCSYHPLLFSNNMENKDEVLFSTTKRRMKYRNDIIENLVSSWNVSNNIQKFNAKLIELYSELVYLPVNETTGFKKAGLNLLTLQHKLNNAKFLLEIIDLLNSHLKKLLQFLNDLHSEFGDFIISNPNEIYEFNYKLNDHLNDSRSFEDIQSSILNKLKSFNSNESKNYEFLEIYDLLMESNWLEQILCNLEMNNCNSNKSKAQIINNNCKNKEILNSNSSNNITSVFTIAKLRKTQTENKSKPKLNKTTNVNISTNNVSNNKLKTYINSNLDSNNYINTSNMTKKEIFLQQLKEQNKIRKEAEKIISQVKNDMTIIRKILNSIHNNDEDELIKVIDFRTSEIIFNICNELLDFKPLKNFSIKMLEEILPVFIKDKKLIGYLISHLSKEQMNRTDYLQIILDSVLPSNLTEINNKLNNTSNYLKYSTVISILIYITSKILYINCIESLDESNKQIQISSQLIFFISMSVKHNNLKVSVNQMVNLLYLYILVLGELIILDQYFSPLKFLLKEIKLCNSDEVELISSLLLFPYPKVRILILNVIRETQENQNFLIKYYTYMNLNIAKEIDIFKLESNNKVEDLNIIFNVSDELISIYKQQETSLNGRIINDLIEILISPIVTKLIQKNISKVISQFSKDFHEIIKLLIEHSNEIFLNSEKKIFDSSDWPLCMKISLISNMIPYNVQYLDHVIPKTDNIVLNKAISKIQARHSIQGLVLSLTEIVNKLDEDFLSFVEISIRFILTQVVDSSLFQEQSLTINNKSNNSNESKNGGKRTVKNIVSNLSIQQESPEKNMMKKYDEQSRNNLQETIINFFVILSTKKDINNFSTQILSILQELSNQYKPLVNPNGFHNTLAFAIGCIASCCSSKDIIVHKITCEIINELLNGSLYKTTSNKAEDNSDKKMKNNLDLPLLTDIPQEYKRILPKLFNMIYLNNDKSTYSYSENELFVNSLEDIDSSHLNCCINIDDINNGKLSIFQLYKISLSNILYSNQPVIQIGSAHIFGSLTKGIGIKYLKDFGILNALNKTINVQFHLKNDNVKIEGILLCVGSLSLYLEYLIEPYTIIFLRNIMQLFSENDHSIRFYSQKTAEIIVKNLSKYGVKLMLPVITQGIEEKQWRIKLTSLQLLGLMAINSPHQLSSFLPKAIQTIYQATSDSHPKVSEAARETLYNIVDLIKNPEIKCISQDLISSLIDPTESNLKKALLSLKSITFVHAIDITTLSLIFPVLLKAIQERGATDLKKDSIQILTSILLLLSDKSDIDPFLPMIEHSIHTTLTDPIPEIRLLTAKLCRSLVDTTGREKASSLLSWLFKTLSLEVNQTLKSGVSAALAEILAAFGIEKFKQLLPFIINQIQTCNEFEGNPKNFDEDLNEIIDASSSSTSTREGYIGLFVYLPKSFGDELGPFMPKILPQLLFRLGDESDTVRDVALKACKALVVQFGNEHAAYILQPLEEGLSNDSWRVRLSCCSLLGTLLNRLIKSQLDSTGKALSNDSLALEQTGFSLQRRSYILAAIYMARSDENNLVKNSATTLWKSIVHNTPQTLKDILPILIRRIINALSTNTGNLHYIAIQSLKDLLDKFGNTLQNKLLPIFYQNLGGILNEDGSMNLNSNENYFQEFSYPPTQVRVGACIGILEILKTIKKNDIKNYSSSFLPIIKIGLLDPDLTVRSLSVECLDLFSSDNMDVLFSTIDWILDDVLSESCEIKNIQDCIENPKISTIELIVQLPHSGIISKILPKVTSKPINIKKIYIIKSMSKIPSQNKLRSSLFEIVPFLIEICVGRSDELDDNLSEHSKKSMMSIVQSLDEQGMETYCTILFEIIRENTPNVNLTISGRYQIENLMIKDLKELDKKLNIMKRTQSIDFLTLSLFMNSPIYETYFSILIKYLIPLAICDISEEVRISASKAFQVLSNTIPRKLIVKASSVMKETISSLVHDPIDNKKHFSDIKLIGLTWDIENFRIYEKYELRSELMSSNNKLIDSITSIYIQGISLGTIDSKEECAIGLGESVKLTMNESIKPITVKLVGPLIRLISDRTTATVVRGALLNNLVLFLELSGAQLRPLLPQIQTILLKYLLDPNEIIRKECSNGIGYLCKYLGNRAEILISDLCSLASKHNQSKEILYSLLSAINFALMTGESNIKPEISTSLRNKLIGMSSNVIQESDNNQHQEVAGKILSSILVYYCESLEIKDIIYPLLIKEDFQMENSNDKNILSILNNCCELNGWEKICHSLENINCDSDFKNCKIVQNFIIPPKYSKNNSWFYLKITSLLFDNIFNSNDHDCRKLAVDLVVNLGNNLSEVSGFSISIILQILPRIIEKDVLMLFPKFSDTNLILQIQKLCEIIIEENFKNLFVEEIKIHLSCYSFGKHILATKNYVSPQNILISVVSLPSIQSLNSKFPVVKLKAEQFLVSLMNSIIQLNNGNADIKDPNVNKFDQVITDLINDINKIYPNQLNQQRSEFIKEYSRRVLSKIDR